MTARIVLDASAAIRVVLRQEGSAGMVDILDTTSLVLAPSLFCAEVANVLWKYLSAGEFSTAEGVEHLELATRLVDEFIPDSELALEALGEAAIRRHPVYDLLYLVAARRFACQVLTLDQRLRTLAEKLDIPVVAAE